MLLFLLFLTLNTFAATESKNAFEKTYPRDNTYCTWKGKRIELMVRGENKFGDLKDGAYGDYLFYEREQTRPTLLKVAHHGADTFRFFLGASPLCSKSHGYIIDEKTLAVLFLKENRPYTDMLAIQLFDAKSWEPRDLIVTNYATDKAMKTDGGFIFRIIDESDEREVGKVAIEGETYVYQEKLFPLWMKYTSKGFALSEDSTFKLFPYADFFKNQQDFFAASGWDSNGRKFTRNFLYEAVNHQTRKHCLLFLESRARPIGNEQWRCKPL